MILWCDRSSDPAEAMARDRALLAAIGEGRIAEPVLRLFRFDPSGITLGRAQDPARELDLARCAADGVPWAVRPTGGRAIFHAEEWTYAFACRLDDPAWGGGLGAVHERVSRLVAWSLRALGVPCDLVPTAAGASGPRAPSPRVRGGPAPPCFASTARYEIVLRGRKLVGSAQRRAGGALLQQGSVLLGPGHLRLADYRSGPESAREEARRALERASAHAGAWIEGGAPVARWADALEPLLEGARRLDGVRGEAPAGFGPAPAAPGRAPGG